MKKFLMYGLVIIIALFVLVIAMSGGESSSSNSTSTTAETKTEEVPEEVIVVSSKELAKAYESNEVAADKQYKGKTLEITGKVDGIDSDISDQAIVKLNVVNQFLSVMAKGDDAFNEYATTLNKGQNVTLICKGDGEVIGAPNLTDCKPKQ